MKRLYDGWQELSSEQRLAGVASLGLFLTMFLPWYQQNGFVSSPRAGALQSRNLNAFAVFSPVEAAVLLVAVAVLSLLFARAERRTFHMPGSDGTVVLIAGGWATLLLIWRLFDKPGIPSHGVAANVGIQWGIFFALGAAGLLIYAGSRMRAARVPEPPLTRRPSDSPSMPPEPPRRPRYPPAPPVAAPSTAGAKALRHQPGTVRAGSEQLSFEDPPAVQRQPPAERT